MATIRELTQNQILVRQSGFGGLFLIFIHKHKGFDTGYLGVR